MKITVTDKTKMLPLLRSALMQQNLINEISLDVNDMFSTIVLGLDDENVITSILNNDQWPKAVEPSLIVQSVEDRKARANGILYLFLNDNIKDMRFLDLGCGDGDIAVAVAEREAAVSVGYDLVSSPTWDKVTKADNLLLTTDFSQVEASKPFDAVLLYDVLDHAENPDAILKQAMSVLKPDGKVFVRCHPWCSRHGGHLYRSLNKAYAHLFLSDDANVKLSGGQSPVQKVIHPLNTYQGWFDNAGLKVASKDVVHEDVEKFFKQQPNVAGIQKWWKNSPEHDLASGKSFPAFQASQQFVDYVLTLADNS